MHACICSALFFYRNSAQASPAPTVPSSPPVAAPASKPVAAKPHPLAAVAEAEAAEENPPPVEAFGVNDSSNMFSDTFFVAEPPAMSFGAPDDSGAPSGFVAAVGGAPSGFVAAVGGAAGVAEGNAAHLTGNWDDDAGYYSKR